MDVLKKKVFNKKRYIKMAAKRKKIRELKSLQALYKETFGGKDPEAEFCDDPDVLKKKIKRRKRYNKLLEKKQNNGDYSSSVRK